MAKTTVMGWENNQVILIHFHIIPIIKIPNYPYSQASVRNVNLAHLPMGVLLKDVCICTQVW